MPSFSDSFIKGYTAGSASRHEKETEKIARERMEEERKRDEARIKRDGQRDEIAANVQKLTVKQKILDLYKEQDHPVEHGPFPEGITRQKKVDDVDFTPELEALGMTGINGRVTPVFADELRARATQKVTDEAAAKLPFEVEKERQIGGIKDQREQVDITHNMPEIGVKKGEKIKPQELSALVSLHNDSTYAPSRIPLLNQGTELPALDPKNAKVVNDAANRYFSGEFKTPGELSVYMGGVKSPLMPYVRQIIADNPDIVAAPPQVRMKLVDIRTTQGMIDTLERQIREVSAQTTLEGKIAKSALLNDTIESMTAMMARGLGEKGALSEGDVKRPKALMPGWIKANFAPEFALNEIAELRGTMQKAKSSLQGYNEKVTREGTQRTPDGKIWIKHEDGSMEEMQ